MKRLLFPLVLTVLLGLALTATPALAARGHVFEKAVGQFGSGAGELNEPHGVVVNEETGDVYVADTGNNRIDEFSSSGTFVRAWGYDVVASGQDNTGADAQQEVTVKATAGTFSLGLTTASGAGELTAGSPTVTGVITSNSLGSFEVGDAITGVAIPANTTIVAVGPGTLTLSAAATSTASTGRTALTATENTGATGTGNLTAGSTQITGVVMRSGEFAVGESISGTGIPAGTTIAAVNPGAGELTLSAAAGSTRSATVLTATDIPYDATEAQLRAALEALPGVGAGAVAVSGGPGDATGSSPYVVTFSGGSFAGNEVVKMTDSAAGLSAGTRTVTVAPTVPGGGVEVCEAGASPPDVCKAGGAVAGGLTSPYLLAIDNDLTSPSHGDLYVASRGGSSRKGEGSQIQKFGPAGSEIGTPITEANGSSFSASNGSGVIGLAVDPAGRLWVSHECPPAVPSINAMGAGVSGMSFDGFDDAVENVFFEEVFPENRSGTNGSLTGSSGLAVDAEGDFFLLAKVNQEEEVEEINSAGGLVGKEIGGLVFNTFLHEGEPPTAVAVDQSVGDVYVAAKGFVSQVNGDNEPVQRLGEGHLTEAGGLAVDAAANGFLYAADAARGQLVMFAPEPPAAPVVQRTAAQSVGVVAATVEAVLIPRSEPSEAPTSYRFEYGPCPDLAACSRSPYPESSPSATAPPDFRSHTVSADLEGLAPATDYHFRLRAENEHGPIVGEEVTFTTFPAGLAFSLADHRAWELVTPPNKHGALIAPPGAGVSRAAAGGEALTYAADAPVEEEAQSNRAWSAQVVARRGQEGWTFQEIVEPDSESTFSEGGYSLFSSDLSVGLLAPPPEDPLLSPEASAWTPYLRDDFASSTETCPGSPSACWTPLVTSKEGYADIQPVGSEFGKPATEGATPDLSHVVLSADGKLQEWAAAAPWEERLVPVGVLPAGEGGQPVECPGGPAHLANGQNSGMGHALSTDGSRVFFETTSSCGAKPHLYLRDVPAAETLLLDTVEPGAEESQRQAEAPGPAFQAASADGSVVFFTDTQRLTESSGSGDLYECRVETGASGELTCALTDLTPLGKGNSLGLEGRALGAGVDGSRLYFVATAVLTGSQENGTGESAQIGQPDLYLAEGATTRFIATLSQAFDSADWAINPEKVSRVSPDGRWLEFMSEQPLTGYDNRDVASGVRDEEVYLYDAAADKGEGRLLCASCEPTGMLPHGEHVLRNVADVNDWGKGPWLGGWLAATVPTLSQEVASGRASSVGQSRYLSDSGRLFFDAHGQLVPQDTNGTWDVYEWEPAGVGTCAASSPTYSERSGGCVALISSGTSDQESAFLEASESGDDIFFLTIARLVGNDSDNAEDVYDARVDGGFPEPPPPIPCEGGESCGGEGTTEPGASTSGSSTFHGPGNLLRCPKGERLKGTRCVRRKAGKKHHEHHGRHHKKKSGKRHHRRRKERHEKKSGKSAGRAESERGGQR